MTFFAIHADDVARACRFYGALFGWTFDPWGPPDFYLIRAGTEPGVVIGAVQPRLEPLEGRGMRGYECSIGVADIEATAERVGQAGGSLLMPPVQIPGVGRVIKFRDTEGNEAAAVQYDGGMQ